MFSLATSTRTAPPTDSIQQTTWWRDHENGDDRNPGTEESPIRTFAEFNRRTQWSTIDRDVTINVAIGTTADTEDVVLMPRFSAFATLYIRSVPVPMFSGTLTSGTLEWSDSGHQEVNAVCSAIPSSWTASDLVGKPMRLANGNSTFAAYDLGSKTARCAGWMHPDYYNDTGVSGDSFEVCDVARCTGHWVVQGIGRGVVWFEDIEIGARGTLHNIECRSDVTASRSRLNGCDVLSQGTLYAIGCYIGDGCRMTYGSCALELTACVRSGASPIEVRPGGTLYVYEQNIAQGLGVLIDQNAQVLIDGIGSLSSCDAAFAYSLQPQSRLDSAGYFWSRNATSRVMSVVGPMSSIGYTSGRAPLNVGTGSPTLLVLAGSSYATLPRTDANSLSNVVVRT